MNARIIASLILFAIILSSCQGGNTGNAETSDSSEASASVQTIESSSYATDEVTDSDTQAMTDMETDEETEVTVTPDTYDEVDVTEKADETDVTDKVVTDAVGGVEFIGALYTKDQLAALDNTLSGYGQGVRVDADNRPEGAVVMQNRYGKYDAVFIAPKSENVYFTFDLGWENGYTAPILDTLNEKGVKAVFFVTMDYCRTSPDIVKRIIDEGHILGNHSIHHYSLPTLTVEQMEQEIMELHNYIKDTYGYEMNLFRPPKGEFSERSLAVTQSLGYQTMLWSFAYLDYDVNAQPSKDAALARVTGAIHGGAVYLLHSVSSTNAAILGDTIDEIRSRGFVFAEYKN